MSQHPTLAQLPDSHPCYVPGVGEVTVGEVRYTEEEPALADSWEATLRMWEQIALNPLERPWESSGPTTQAPAGSQPSESTSADRTAPYRSSGTGTGRDSSGASEP